MKNLIISVFVLLLIAGCNKYDDTAAAAKLQIPPFTEKGANTFGCLANGSVWANFGALPEHVLLGAGPLDSSKVVSGIEPPPLYGVDTGFRVSAQYSLVRKGKDLRVESMSIQLPITGSLKGTHRLLADSLGIFRYVRLSVNQYTSKPHNPFTVIVTKDSVINSGDHIVSGRFYGVLYNYNLTDSVTISAGVFDTRTRY
ncbi:MAG: hypothetical protein ACXVB0_15990 [Mucilaginibacter sp.]